MHAEHFFWLAVEPALKPGIAHFVHFAPQLSHSRLLLSAMRFVPGQIPFESGDTHESFKKTSPSAHVVHWFEEAPVQVLHWEEHGEQAAPAPKLPSGQTVPPEAVCGGGLHLVLSLASTENVDLQVEHKPVPSWHCVHPLLQVWQSPEAVKKNPGEHFEHNVPSSPVVNPTLQVHCPFDPQTPFLQLHVVGSLATAGFKHLPEPLTPSSHVLQFAGHAWHLGPKNPKAQDSQDTPVNPEEH